MTTRPTPRRDAPQSWPPVMHPRHAAGYMRLAVCGWLRAARQMRESGPSPAARLGRLHNAGAEGGSSSPRSSAPHDAGGHGSSSPSPTDMAPQRPEGEAKRAPRSAGAPARACACCGRGGGAHAPTARPCRPRDGLNAQHLLTCHHFAKFPLRVFRRGDVQSMTQERRKQTESERNRHISAAKVGQNIRPQMRAQAFLGQIGR